MFGRFRKKKDDVTTPPGSTTPTNEPVGAPITPPSHEPSSEMETKSASESARDSGGHFSMKKEEKTLTLSEVLDRLLERMNKLEKERTELVAEIYAIGEQAEKEAEDLGKELSTLKEQTGELTEVLNTIRTHRESTMYPQTD
jgi:seryl-tRNA synthetase